MKKNLLSIALISLITLTTSCSSSFFTLEEIIASGKLLVATNAEFAPFEYKEGVKFKGIDMDIARAYGKYIDVEVLIRDMDFDAALLATSSNKTDFTIAGITKNPARETTLSFTDSYYIANQVVIVKENSKYVSCSTQEELLISLSNDKARIGCQRGTTGQYYIEGNEDWDFDGITNSTCVVYDSGILAATALSNNQIDAIVIDQVPATIFVKNIKGIKVLDYILTEEEYAIAVSKGNDTLLESLNTFIAEIKENGVLDTIVGEYYGESK